MDVVVLTDRRYLASSSGAGEPAEGYIDNLLTEDGLVMDALVACGLTVDRKAWCDDRMDWSQTKSALFRTTWDYFDAGTLFHGCIAFKPKRDCSTPPPLSIGTWTSIISKTSNSAVKVVPTAYVRRDQPLRCLNG